MSIGRTQEQTEGIESDALTFNVNVLYEATVDVNYAKTKTPIRRTFTNNYKIIFLGKS